MTTKWILALAEVVLLTSAMGVSTTAQSSSGPSFSCLRAPEGGVEEMICRDADLARQDRVMATAFNRARAAVRGSEGLGELMSSQLAWLRERAACANLRTQKGYCVENTTAQRIETLEQWATLRMNPERAQRSPAKTGETASSRPPRGPSFDCTKARTAVERTICNSRDLSLQDRQVASLYAQLQRLIGTNPNQSAFAAQDQRDYLANRNRCGANPTTLSACLQVAHENRIMRLEELIEDARSRT
jgi:uncharacterized protein